MDSSDPRTAVVMITYNRRQEVLRSLGHLTALPERPHIVLVDNGSTDGTAAAVGERFPQVRVLPAGANLGAAGRTLGARQVEAPYVAFADDDTWWEPGGLRRAADLFDAHPRLAVLTGRVLVGPENREDPVCRELRQSPLPREPGMPGWPLLGFLAGASVVRRSAFLEAGGFPERLFIGAEEELLATDLAARSWWLCYVPEVVVHHYPSAQRDAYARRWHSVRNTLWFAWLRRPLPSALRRTLRTVRSAPWDRASLRGFTAALAGLPWVLRERRVVPRHVEDRLRLLDHLDEAAHVLRQGPQGQPAAAEDPVSHLRRRPRGDRRRRPRAAHPGAGPLPDRPGHPGDLLRRRRQCRTAPGRPPRPARRRPPRRQPHL